MKKNKLPSLVIWFGIVSLLTDVGTEMIYPLLPLFLADVLHAPRAFIGAVEGAAEATASLLKLLSGRWSDRLRRKKPLTVIGYALSSLVRPLVGLALQPWHVLATRVVDRVGKGLRGSPRDALLADATRPEERGRAYGFHQAMDNAGALVGPLLATALIAAGLTLRNVFLLAAVPGALAMGTLIFGVREPEPRPSSPSPGGARKVEPPRPSPSPGGARKVEAAAVDPATAAKATASSAATVPLGPTLHRYFVAVGLFGLGNSSDAFLLLRAQQCGVAVPYVPLLWMAHNATKAALSTWGGELSDRIGRRGVIVAGWVLYALTYLAFGFATQVWQIWALFIVYGIYYSLVEGAEKALVAELAPAGARGRAFGWFNGVVGLAALPASLAFGAVADHWGARVAFTASALLAALASLWLALAVRSSARGPEPAATPPPPAP